MRTTKKCLENFDFPKNLLDFDRLQDLDDAFLVIEGVAALIDFRVFTTA